MACSRRWRDYLADTTIPMVLAKIPAVFGLAILLPQELAAANPELARLVEAWRAPHVESFVERLEIARVAMMTGSRS